MIATCVYATAAVKDGFIYGTVLVHTGLEAY